MKIIVEYNGKVYESIDVGDINPEQFFRNLHSDTTFRMKLKDGGTLVLGTIATNSAAFTFKD